MDRYEHGAILVLTLACGCAASPTPSAFAVTPAEAQVNSVYDEMAIGAASQLRIAIPGKTIAMYRSTGTSSTLRDLVNAVMEAYDFREVKPGEARVECAARSRMVRTPVMPSCTIDVADVLLQVNSVQITGDSGFVGGFRTEVPAGSDKMRTSAFCLTAVRNHDEWLGARLAAVAVPRDCSSPGKH